MAGLNQKNGFVLPNDQRIVRKIINETDFQQINVNSISEEQRQAAMALQNRIKEIAGNDPYLTYEIFKIASVS